MKAQLIDTHAHLSAPEYKQDVSEVIARAQEAGVSQIVVIGAGYGKQSAQDSLILAERYECLSVAVGLHPCDSVEKISHSWFDGLIGHPKVKALGETGLDFYWDKTDPEIQKHNFRVHIEVAQANNLPLVIHSRNAAQACLEILIDTGASSVGGVFHCYSEDAVFAQKLREINFKVSFPGVLTFKKADTMRAIAKEIPLEQIMVETDCPFLAPQRMRGKRCEPAYVVDVAETLAQVKGISLDEVAIATTRNAKAFFGI